MNLRTPSPQPSPTGGDGSTSLTTLSLLKEGTLQIPPPLMGGGQGEGENVNSPNSVAIVCQGQPLRSDIKVGKKKQQCEKLNNSEWKSY